MRPPSPGAEAQGGDGGGEGVSLEELPGGELPGGELPGGELPGGELPGEEPPGGELQRETLRSGEIRDEERFTRPLRLPYQLGLLLAVNAIPDAYCAIDGPDCVYRKSEWIFGMHDLRSTLLDVHGRHRIAPTLLNSDALIRSGGEELGQRLRAISANPAARLILINAMPHVQIIGTDYATLIDALSEEIPIPILQVPNRALEGDWLDAFADTLRVLAEELPLGEPRQQADAVAIVGHLWDRGEEDCAANVAELERMVRALDLEPVSTWLSGRPTSHLARASEASWIVGLPHAEDAAARLAARIGATHVPLPLPFGLEASQAFSRGLGEATGRGLQAERFCARELRRIIPRFERAVPRYLVGKRVAFCGDPHLFDGFYALATELGMEIALLASTARQKRRPPAWPGSPLYAPPRETLLRRAESAGRLDLSIATSSGVRLPAEGSM
ncbi:MAG: nitrogenase component 1, partial [Myxococcales bacterium]|nr:nitrogenase component 1 [Myxococcales bacterium]